MMPEPVPGEQPAVHRSVLYDETLAALQPRAGGFLAVDCTTNGGGHAAGLLERSSPDGRLLGLDADAAALDLARQRLASYAGRFRLVHSNFRDLAAVAHAEGVEGRVDAVVADLGLSSVQLEHSGRGFSFRPGEPLDMRFDAGRADLPTAADLLNQLPEAELADLFFRYGEEPRARRLARSVVQRRERAPFAHTEDLVAAVTRALGPQRGRVHPATRPFQALRIAVNDELGALEEGLDAAVHLLAPGGRLAVITFHSLEDRIVKWRFRAWAEATALRGALVRIVTRKPIVPGEAETRANTRARSAKLRVAERLGAGSEGAA